MGGVSCIGRCSHRTVFGLLGVNLVFGAFNRIVDEPQSRATKPRFLRETAAVIGEIQAAGAITPRSIAATLNERGILTARGRSWTAATIRNLLLRASE